MAHYADLQTPDIEEIARGYALTLIDSQSLQGGSANSSYRLETLEGQFVLTVFDTKTRKDVENLGNLLIYLEEHQFRTTRLRRTAENKIMSCFGDKPILVKGYIPGRVCEQLDDRMLRQAGSLLAKLNLIPPPDNLPCDHPYGFQSFGLVIGVNMNPDYEAWLSKQRAKIEEFIHSGLQRTLIHGDMFADNLLFEGGSLTALIDFEEACHNFLGFDLGMAVLGLCRSENRILLGKARQLVSGYEEIYPLPEVEKINLQNFIDYAASATSFWRFWKFNIDTPSPSQTAHFLEMVAIADQISSIPPDKFYRAVFG
jgi:homoserine kinase type II